MSQMVPHDYFNVCPSLLLREILEMAISGRSVREIQASGVLNRQRLVHMIAGRVQGTGTAAMLEGGNELTLTDNGTGDYTLAISPAYARVPTVLCQSLTADAIAQVGTISASSIQVLGFDATDGTTAKDIDFHILIVGSDAEDVL